MIESAKKTAASVAENETKSENAEEIEKDLSETAIEKMIKTNSKFEAGIITPL
jgi:hypothetical protein